MKTKLFYSVLFILLFVGCSSTKIQTTKSGNIFSVEDKLLVPRYGHSAVSLGNGIYILGGRNRDSQYLTEIEYYDPIAEYHLISKADLIPRRNTSVVECNGKIYILGGEINQNLKIDINIGFYKNTQYDRYEKSLAFMEVFDPKTGKIEKIKDMPFKRAKSGIIAKDSKIYLFGGYHSSIIRDESKKEVYLNNVSIYDTKTKTWSEGTPMNNERTCKAVLNGNKVYIIGGYDGHSGTKDVEVYNIDTDTWEVLDDAPFNISANSILVKNDIIYLFGDYDELNRVVTYNIKTNKWKKIQSNFNPSRHNASVIYNDDIYVLGGLKLNTKEEIVGLKTIQKLKTD